MTYEELIAFIKANVFENNEELITGENLQKVELAVAEFFHTSDTSSQAEIDKLIADLKAEVQRATAKETELEGRVDANEGQIRNKLNIVDAIGKKTRVGGEIFNDYAGNTAGSYAHAEGYDTKAFGRDSHAEGEGTIANNEAEHAQGKFNYPTSDSVDSTGIGTSDDERKNATLTTAGGKHYILGVGGYLGRDIIGMKDVASVINEALASIQSNSESIATNAEGIATNKEDITMLKAVKREVYPNNTGTNVFNLSTDSTSAEIKQVLTTAQGVFALPNAGDEFQVLENSTLRDSGIVISRSETEATQDIIVLSNNLTAGYIQVTSLTLEYNKRIGADSLKVQRAEHQVVDPKLIDENKLAKLYADQERTSKEVNEYNITAINGSPYVSLQGAISALNSYLKDGKFVGTKVTWTQAETNKVFTHMYTGGSFVNVQSWKELPNDLKTINGESLSGSGNIPLVGMRGEGGEIFNDYENNKANTYAHAEGQRTYAINKCSHAEGCSTSASGESAHAEGESTTASGKYSHTEGFNTYADGDWGSHAEGLSTSALGESSHAEGKETTANGDRSHAEGTKTSASARESHAEGWKTEVKGLTLSDGTKIGDGVGGHAEGVETKVVGRSAHAEGTRTRAYGTHSHAEGFETFAVGDYSHAEGQSGGDKINQVISSVSGNTFVSDYGSYEIGQHLLINNIIYEVKEISEDSQTITLDKVCDFTTTDVVYDLYGGAFGKCSHAEGFNTKASGDFSHAEGNYTTAVNDFSHAEGWSTLAECCAHAEGDDTKALGLNSHTEGYNTVSNNFCQHTQGFFNIVDNNPNITFENKIKPSFVVGNGGRQDYLRHDSLRLLNNGNLYLQGVGGFTGGEDYPTFESAIASKTIKSVQEVIAELQAKIK